MIDAESRRRFGELLRHFAVGLISTDDFGGLADECMATHDEAVHEIAEVVDSLFHDLWSYRFRGSLRLHPRVRRMLARCVLFLRSGLPYKWPESSIIPVHAPVHGRRNLSDLFCTDLRSVVPGLERRHRMAFLRELRAMGPAWHVWPFSSVEQFRAARTTPTYLCQ